MNNDRPNRNEHVLEALKSDQTYTPASIAQFAKDNDLLRARDPDQEKLEMHRMMILLGGRAKKHGFPVDGDEQVIHRGQAPTPGWFGWRWKQTLRDD